MARYSGARTWKSSCDALVRQCRPEADDVDDHGSSLVVCAHQPDRRLLDPRLESRWSSRHPYASNVEYEVLGHLRVLDKNGAEVQLSAPKLRTLLALLLVNRGRPVSVDRIADALWGDHRPALLPTWSRATYGTCASVSAPGRSRRSREDTGSTSGGNLSMRSASRIWSAPVGTEEALALWHGAALEEWAEQPWARANAARLEEMRLSAVEARLAQEIDAGLASAVLAELAALVEEHPLT